jgi:DNA-binding NarL/FixJ family response regulator
VDDDARLRAWVREGLTAAGVTVAGEAARGGEGVTEALRLHPDVVLMDVVMPDLDGITATRRIAGAAPDIRVLLLTTSGDPDLGLLGLLAGACGHLTKSQPIEDIVDAVGRAAGGEVVVTAELTGHVLAFLRAGRDTGGALALPHDRLGG